MAEITDLEHKRAAERRLALLVLAGEQPKPDGACLDPEELASLVEGKLPPEQAEACLDHLAHCEYCYALWRQLDRDWQEQEGKSGQGSLLRLISRPRFLTAVGSLLAAAASIAVFLNITTEADRHSLMRLPDTSVQERTLPLPSPEPASEPVPALSADKGLPPPASPVSPGQGPTFTTEEQAAAPAAQPTERRKKQAIGQAEKESVGVDDAAKQMQQTKAAKRAEEVAPIPAEKTQQVVGQAPVSADRMEEKRELDATSVPEKRNAAPAAAPQAASRSTDTAPAPPAAVAGGAQLLTVSGWQNRIREGCRHQPAPEFFSTLIEQGKQLLRQPAHLQTGERQRIERILVVLGSQQQPERCCRAVLDILGPEPQR
jgi:hypothetical protein